MAERHPIDVHVGSRLKLRRSILGLSQDAIGSAIGVTFQQVQKYESGANRMGASRLYDFAKILKVPVSYFFDEYKGPTPTENTRSGGMAESSPPDFQHEKQIASRETMEMMRAFYNIRSKQIRKRVFELIKAIAEDSATPSS